MNMLSLVLAIGAGLLVLGGIFQGIVAGIELTKHAVGSGQIKRWSAIILTCIVLASISGYASYASYASSPKSDPLSPPVATSPTVPSVTSTLTAQPTETPTIPPTSTPGVATAGPPGSIRLSCACSDPVVVTITKIDIQPQQNRMIWSLSFYNNSQSAYDADFSKFYLQKGDQTQNPAGSAGEPTYTPTGLAINTGQIIHAGDTKQSTLTFSFVPDKGNYTLASQLVLNEVTMEMVNFDSIVIPFT